MRKFTKMEVATIKRTAQNVANFVAQKERLAKKIEDLKAQYDAVNDSLSVWEAPIMKLTGGYTTEDLVNKVVNTSVNSEGKTISTVKYELKYPETVVPVDIPASVEEVAAPSNENNIEFIQFNNFNNEI